MLLPLEVCFGLSLFVLAISADSLFEPSAPEVRVLVPLWYSCELLTRSSGARHEDPQSTSSQDATAEEEGSTGHLDNHWEVVIAVVFCE